MARRRRDSGAPAQWLRAEQAAGRQAALPVIVCALLGVAAAIGQTWCIAAALGAALAGLVRLNAVMGFAALAVVRAGLDIAGARAAAGAGARARRRLRSDAMARLIAAGPVMLRGTHSGDLAATVVDRIEALDGFFARWIPAAAIALAGPLLVVAVVVTQDWVAALILAVAGCLVPAWMALAGLGAAQASRRQFVAVARLQARFLDRVRGIATIVMHGRAEDEARTLAQAADELRRRTLRVLRVAFLSSAGLDLAAAAALVLIALHDGATLTGGSPAAVAGALFVLMLVPEFFAPLRAFALAYQDRMQAQAAAEALSALPPLPPPAPTLPVRTVAARGVTVQFDDVVLRWDPFRAPALDGLSFRVTPGETLVLAGPSGAGKTTVMEILLGFVRPDSGRVTINGADLADLTAPALARLSAWVGQRPVLFAGTIADNIRFARPEASDADIEEAAKAARVLAFSELLPDGLATSVGEGGYGLSGGQAQRVAVARAWLKNAPLLLLDEPTAHLDPATEAELLDSLRRLSIGRTVILASHSAAAHAFGGRRLDMRDGRAALATAKGAA